MERSAERDERVMALLAAARQRPPAERDGYLRAECDGDEELLQEVLETLDWEERMGHFLLDPVITATRGDPPFRTGDIIAGRFQIIGEIGQGGMGVVYEAFDRKRSQRIAIKAAKAGFRRLLSPELEEALKVRHPNICLVNEIHTAATAFGEIDFLTMEFLEGETLSARLRRGKLDPGEAMELARQLCAGLAEAHRSDVIHRDLKSSNIILTRTSGGALRAVITDFGLAGGTALASGDLAGTPRYMAPELWQGGAASRASDLYALGVILYECVTGRLPFDEEAPEQGQTSRPTAPSKLAKGLDPRWDAAILACLDPIPSARPRSATGVLALLEKRTRKGSWVAAGVIAVLTAAVLTPALREPIAGRFRPANIRLAVLPARAPDNLSPLAGGMLQHAADRIRRMRSGGRTVVVIPPDEASRTGVRTADQAQRTLHATHALESKLRRDGDEYVAEGAVVDLETRTRLREFSGTYSQLTLAAIPSALAGTVSASLRLERTAAPERLAASAAGHYFRGLYFLRRDWRSYDEAIPLLQEAARLDPRSPLPWAGLTEAQIMKSQGTHDPKWLDVARQSFRAAQSLSPDSVEVRLAAGELNHTAGWYEKALDDYRRVLEFEPRNTEALRSMAITYDAMDLPDQAIETYRKAIQLEPGYYATYQELGVFYYRRGRYPEAEEHFRKAIQAAPGLVQAYTNLAIVMVNRGQYSDAASFAQESLRLKETSGAFNTLGVALAYQERDGEAVAYYQKALATDDRNYLYLLNLADACRRLGRSAEAEAAYRKAMQMALAELTENPRQGYARAFVGYSAARLGDRERAEDEIGQALRLSPSDSVVLTHAVLTYEALGERGKALDILAQATPDVLQQLERQPDTIGLRRDPRFQQMMTTTNSGR